MNKSIKYSGLTRVANSYVNRLDQSQKLRNIANRGNYSHKVKLLHEKISQQYTFWSQKQNPIKEKLEDVKKDLIFIKSQIDTTEFKKEKIDLLVSKYGIS